MPFRLTACPLEPTCYEGGTDLARTVAVRDFLASLRFF
jgi:hypothetical protein